MIFPVSVLKFRKNRFLFSQFTKIRFRLAKKYRLTGFWFRLTGRFLLKYSQYFDVSSCPQNGSKNLDSDSKNCWSGPRTNKNSFLNHYEHFQEKIHFRSFYEPGSFCATFDNRWPLGLAYDNIYHRKQNWGFPALNNVISPK